MTEENRSADTADTTADGGAPVREESKAAARWWREVLAGPPTHDNGDETLSLMGRLLGGISPELTGEELDAFEEELARHLDAMIVRDRESREETRRKYRPDWPTADFWLTIATNYHPDMELDRAIEAAAARTERPEVFGRTVRNRLPWKTVMWIRPEEVKVAHGYGAEAALIYPKEGVLTGDGS